ncbi:serine hydrolase [uncultured Eudoraea sp.]|uniref:serine hydrolase domain-containing protein n=1 Tax=uncultured Eudoraea sp. TaxID=1035614 RepID=UPI00261A0D13|nr:serine hydrolase [uncultured Eudoraea sp.]
MKHLIPLIFLTLFTAMAYSQELNQVILDSIKSKSAESHSDAVIIKQNGKVIYQDYFGKEEVPIYIASAGKSLTSLAIGKLLDKKLLDSLDQPIYTIYPQWNQGRKKGITVRMLLNHTSGIQNNPNASVELEPAPDYKVDNIIELALSAELSNEPSEKVEYNNKAVTLLGGIVQELSGKSFDQFYVDEFFKPMNIAQYEWIKDKSGNPTVHGAFVIKPSDFLKFGELVLNEGVYNGNQIISKEWIKESLKQGQEFTPIWGLLWWRLPEYEKRIIDDEIWTSWKETSVDKEFLRKLKPIKNMLFENKNDFYNTLESKLGKNWNQILNIELPANVKSSKRIYSDNITAYYADGYRGNYLVIDPKSKIVAVRCADFEGFNYQTDFFSEFVSLVSKLGK